MERLLIIDGSALLFQSFYGMPKKILNNKGEYVEAVICFVGILFKTIRILKPNKLLIVFDGENKLERQDINPEYKANRATFDFVEEKDNPFCQLEIIKKVLSKLNFTWIETTNCEADDLIASVVNDYKQSYEMVISTNDKDFYQLIDKNVSVFTYRGKISKLWTEKEIIDKYGFSAKYFATFKALFGDKSDNINGINGFGEKTTSKLIQMYGNLTNIYSNVDKLEKRIMELLKLYKTLVFNNYKIVELHSKSNLFKLPPCNYILNDEVSSIQVLKQLNVLN